MLNSAIYKFTSSNGRRLCPMSSRWIKSESRKFTTSLVTFFVHYVYIYITMFRCSKPFLLSSLSVICESLPMSMFLLIYPAALRCWIKTEFSLTNLGLTRKKTFVFVGPVTINSRKATYQLSRSLTFDGLAMFPNNSKD